MKKERLLPVALDLVLMILCVFCYFTSGVWIVFFVAAILVLMLLATDVLHDERLVFPLILCTVLLLFHTFWAVMCFVSSPDTNPFDFSVIFSRYTFYNILTAIFSAVRIAVLLIMRKRKTSCGSPDH